MAWLSLYSRGSILSWQSMRARGPHFSRFATWSLNEIHSTWSETFTDRVRLLLPGPEPLALLILSLPAMPFGDRTL